MVDKHVEESELRRAIVFVVSSLLQFFYGVCSVTSHSAHRTHTRTKAAGVVRDVYDVRSESDQQLSECERESRFLQNESLSLCEGAEGVNYYYCRDRECEGAEGVNLPLGNVLFLLFPDAICYSPAPLYILTRHVCPPQGRGPPPLSNTFVLISYIFFSGTRNDIQKSRCVVIKNVAIHNWLPVQRGPLRYRKGKRKTERTMESRHLPPSVQPQPDHRHVCPSVQEEVTKLTRELCVGSQLYVYGSLYTGLCHDSSAADLDVTFFEPIVDQLRGTGTGR